MRHGQPIARTRKPEGIFYGWFVVGGCMMIRLGLGIPNYALSVFLKPMCDALHVSRGVFSAYSTFSYTATMIMLPVLGVWFRKYNLKRLMWLGACATTLALFGYSLITKVWHFYLFAAINGLFGGMLNSIPMAMLVSNWFKERRAFATGLAFTGSGISAMLVSPLAAYLIENISWMAAFRVMAALYLVFTFIPLLFLIKVRPEEMGEKPLGAQTGTDSLSAEPASGFTAKQSLRTVTFWMIGICMFLTGFVYMGTQNHVIAYLTDIGHSSMFSALMYSIIMGFDTVGKIVLGMLYDRIGLRKTNVYIYSVFFLSEILLIFAAAPPVAVIFAVCLGMTVAVQTGAYPVIINRLLGDRAYSQNYGNLTVCYFAGMAVGVLFSGVLYDLLGTYLPVWIGYAAVVVLILGLLLLTQRQSAREFEPSV